MSFSDKISWIGGMMGLFTGFSVISGIEILYWLWFKVLFHKHDVEVKPEGNEASENNDEEIAALKVNIFNITKNRYNGSTFTYRKIWRK